MSRDGEPSSSRRPIVTLTTDFGTRDPYVGAMKGVILSICPEATIVDITHEIAPQDVTEGALALRSACPGYPAGSIHVAVVDPGVGSRRRALAVSSGGRLYIGPDNGIFTLVCGEDSSVRSITNRSVQAETVSATFHGRDIFAPAAAHVAQGLAPERLGRKVRRIERLDLPTPEVGRRRVLGQVLHVDRFGNLISNIAEETLDAARSPERAAVVRIGDMEIDGIRRTYTEAPRGALLALIGSTGLLEISLREGSAAVKLGAGRGTRVEVTVTRRSRPSTDRRGRRRR